MLVKEAMRRQLIHLPADASIAKGIHHLLKFKVNAVLIVDEDQRPAGVVSKTDLIGAFYAGLPIDIALGDIMTGPPLFCCPDDELESALEVMRNRSVHRLYVRGAEASTLIGTLSYTDVVALLYRYCRACPKSSVRRVAAEGSGDESHLLVREIMTASVVSFLEKTGLTEVVEGLTAHRFGAVLICGHHGEAKGVISKTDLVRAYLHRVSLEAEAATVMNTPVAAFDQNGFLWEAIQHMFITDVQRLFIHAGDPLRITGVLSLSDAAQARSGSCRACLPSRFMTPA
jgi:signal-transduction protein with cAMP-binding, CBS, and nucleotidyltransferase domain